ncbi:hypothetical protein NPIL_136001 [Nephila pilipes]|uniref:Uncharacterized protein n=1 Tax=Nephila pilipes TaxID=299642 RepID=A0A8X6Q9Y5_NEPPI|nr:hypothetical protein NPIL_136001 [Nephila pilipes]
MLMCALRDSCLNKKHPQSRSHIPSRICTYAYCSLASKSSVSFTVVVVNGLNSLMPYPPISSHRLFVSVSSSFAVTNLPPPIPSLSFPNYEFPAAGRWNHVTS